MERETKQITTTGGHVVVFKSYLSGRENSEIKTELFKGVVTSGDKNEKPKIPLSNIIPYERKQIEALIVSFDGVTENALEAFENLQSTEYDAAVLEIKKEAGISLVQAE
jgi:hypothetical protein